MPNCIAPLLVDGGAGSRARPWPGRRGRVRGLARASPRRPPAATRVGARPRDHVGQGEDDRGGGGVVAAPRVL